MVEPGSYATDAPASAVRAGADPHYDRLRDAFAAYAQSLDLGDPAAAGRALLRLVDAEQPPLRVFFGAQGHPMIQQVYADRLTTWAAWAELSAEAHGPGVTAP